MSIVSVELAERSYDIIIDALDSARSRAALAERTAGRRVMLVADSNTAAMGDAVAALCPDATIFHRAVFPAGEASKTFASAAMLCGEAAKAGCDRSSVFIALGGGVTGDLTGFTASIFMRGVDFIQIPTSLLAMVDSSVGGKTGVDLPEGKNLAGTFYQPKLVLIDPTLLQTLPKRELIGAMAEVVKYGVIADEAFFARLEADAERFGGAFDAPLYGEIIRRSCELKAETVAADERESGCRALLNYGHTFGHAAEMLSDFQLSHGEAVAVGMAVAGRLSVMLGMWSEEQRVRQERLLLALGLPVRLDSAFDAQSMLDLMGRDKKTRNGKLNLILPNRIGKASIVGDAPLETVVASMEASH